MPVANCLQALLRRLDVDGDGYLGFNDLTGKWRSFPMHRSSRSDSVCCGDCKPLREPSIRVCEIPGCKCRHWTMTLTVSAMSSPASIGPLAPEVRTQFRSKAAPSSKSASLPRKALSTPKQKDGTATARKSTVGGGDGGRPVTADVFLLQPSRRRE